MSGPNYITKTLTTFGSEEQRDGRSYIPKVIIKVLKLNITVVWVYY